MGTHLVLGLGKSGIASARRLLEQGDDFVIYAGASSSANATAAHEFIDAGVRVFFDTEEVQGTYDTCIVSPGIPQTGSFYASAQEHSTEIITEPEFAWRLSPEGWAAVTGTNGKTTTTSLLAHVLNACGKPAQACGNIGDTCLAAVMDRKPDEILVAELSSYQLASTVRFAPQVAVLLNITPDHISWHGSFEAYGQAKFKVFENMGKGSTAVIAQEVLNAYPDLIELIEKRGIRLVHVGVELGANCAFMDESGVLTFKDEDGRRFELVNENELSIKGSHNVENALCAASAALAIGCDVEKLREGLASFNPLEHRLEPCGNVEGVSFFNDSKATNVDATLKALTAFPDGGVILLLGGRDKNTSLDELVAACEKSCSAIIAYGEAGQRFFEAFEGSSVDSHLADHLEDALACAFEIAHDGESVVLSPACASFDEFDSFEHRGTVFKEMVGKLRSA